MGWTTSTNQRPKWMLRCSNDDLSLLPLYLQDDLGRAVCRIQDALAASYSHSFQCFVLHQIPFRHVQLVACVVGRTIREKAAFYLIDDGTQLLECVLQPRPDTPGFWPGDAVRVQGSLRIGWRNEYQVVVSSMRPVEHPNEECTHILAANEWWSIRRDPSWSLRRAYEEATSTAPLAASPSHTPRARKRHSSKSNSPNSLGSACSSSQSEDDPLPSFPPTRMRSSSFAADNTSLTTSEASYLDSTANFTASKAQRTLVKPSLLKDHQLTPETLKLYISAFFQRHCDDIYSAKQVLKNQPLRQLAAKVADRQSRGLVLKQRLPAHYASTHPSIPMPKPVASPTRAQPSKDDQLKLVKEALGALRREGVLVPAPPLKEDDATPYYQRFQSSLLDQPLLRLMRQLAGTKKHQTVSLATIVRELREGGESNAGIEMDRWYHVREEAVERALKRLCQAQWTTTITRTQSADGVWQYAYCS